VGGTLHITYWPRADTSPEGELSALASVYAYLLKSHDSKKANKPAPEPVGRNDGIEVKGDTADDDILSQ
jgi:hypothetical protein